MCELIHAVKEVTFSFTLEFKRTVSYKNTRSTKLGARILNFSNSALSQFLAIKKLGNSEVILSISAAMSSKYAKLKVKD